MKPWARSSRRPPASARSSFSPWRLEPLEPRLLLSADPVLGAVQALLLPPADDTLAAAYDAPTAWGPHADVAFFGAPGIDAVLPVHDVAALAAEAAALPTLVVGQPGSAMAVLVQRADGQPVQLATDLVIWADGPGGEVLISSALDAPSITIHGSGHTTTVSANSNAATGNNIIADSIRISGERTISAANGSISLGGNLTHWLGGDSAATVDKLTLSAPNGNITFAGAVGLGQDGSDALDAITVTAARNVTFMLPVIVNGTLTIDATGVVTFNDQLTLKNGASLIIRGAEQVVMRSAVTLETGTSPTAGDILIAAGEIDLTMGEELIRGSGAVTLRPAAVGGAMALFSPPGAGTAAVLNLEAAELRSFADGFSGFTLGWVLAGRAQVGGGAVQVGASTGPDSIAMRDPLAIYGGSITVSDYSDPNAILRMGGTDRLRLDAVSAITIANEIEAQRIELASTSAQIEQINSTADARINEPLRALTLVAQAGNGIALPSLEVKSLDARNTGSAGDIALGINLPRATARFDATAIDGSVDVTRLAQTSFSGGGIELVTRGGNINIVSSGSGVSLPGTGALVLDARGTGADLSIAAAVALGSGSARLSAADALSTQGAGSVVASGAASIVVNSGSGALTLGAAVTSAGGIVSFGSGGALDLSGQTLNAGASGQLTLQSIGNLTVGRIEASSAITLRSSTGSILDGLPGDGPNLVGSNAAITLSAASGIGTGAAPLRLSAGTLAAEVTGGSGGIFIWEESGLAIAPAGLKTNGGSAGQGAIVVRVAEGPLELRGPVNAASTTLGSGMVLLQTLSQGNLSLSSGASVTSGGGSISLLSSLALSMAAGTEVRARAAGQGVDLLGMQSLSMAASALAATAGGPLRLESSFGLTLGRLDAGTGAVSVKAGSGIGSAAGTPAGPDIVAGALRMQSEFGAVGTPSDPLSLQITRLAVQASAGAYLSATDTLTVGAGHTTAGQRINDSGVAAAAPALGAISGLTANAPLVLSLARGDLTVETAATAAAGSLRLEAPGKLQVAAPVSAPGGVVTLLAGGDMGFTAAGDVSAANGIDAEAGGALAMDSGTLWASAGITALKASGPLVLGTLAAAQGDVLIHARTVAAATGSSGIDVSARSLRMSATGSGAADGLGSVADPLTLAVDRLALSAPGAGGVFLSEIDGLRFAPLAALDGARVQRDGSVAANPGALAALGGASSGGALVIAAGGALQLDAGQPMSAVGGLRLSAGEMALAAPVASTGGALTLQSSATMRVDAALSAPTGIDVRASGGLLFGAGSTVSSSGPVGLAAGGDLLLSRVSATAVGLSAGGNIIDGDLPGAGGVDVNAGTLVVSAGGGIGSAANALEVAVGTLAARATAGLFVTDSDALVVASGSVAAIGVGTSGASQPVTALNLQGVDGGGGAVVLTSAGAELRIDAAVRSAGGPLRLDASAGALVLNAALDTRASASATGGGPVTLLSAAAMNFGVTGSLASGGGSVDIQSGGSFTMADGASVASGGAVLRVYASGAATLTGVDAGSGPASVEAAALRDGGAMRTDISAGALRLRAFGAEADGGIGLPANALDISAGRLGAIAIGAGVYLQQTGAVLLTLVDAPAAARVQADGAVAALVVDERGVPGLSSAENVVLDATGSIVSTLPVAAYNGNLRLAAHGTASDLALLADAYARVGRDASLIAGRDLVATNLMADSPLAADGPRALNRVDIAAGRDMWLKDGGIVWGGSQVMVQAGGVLAFDDLRADTGVPGIEGASPGLMAVIGGVAVYDLGGDAAGEADIRAGQVHLRSGGAIGDAAQPIALDTARLALRAGAAGAFVTDSGDLAIGRVQPTATLIAGGRVGSDGLPQALAPEALFGAVGTGALRIDLAGALTLEGGAASDGPVVQIGTHLRLSSGGPLNVNGPVMTGASASLLAGGAIAFAAAGDVSVAGIGTLDVQSAAAISMADGAVLQSAAGAVRVLAAGAMTLGSVLTSGAVSLQALSIGDSGTTDVDVAAYVLRLVTTGNGTTQGAGTGAQPLQLNVALLSADVAGTGSGGLFIRNAGSFVVGPTGGPMTVERIGTAGLTLVNDAVMEGLRSAGNAVLVAPASSDMLVRGDVLRAAGNVLLSGGGIVVNAPLESTTGSISVNAPLGLYVNADLSVKSAQRSIDLAGGPFGLGAQGSVVTAGGDLRIDSSASIVLEGRLRAVGGVVSLQAVALVVEGPLKDAGVPTIESRALRVAAGQAIGSAADPLDTAVATLGARSGAGGAWIVDQDALRVDSATATVRRVGAAGTTTDLNDLALAGITTSAGGGIGLETRTGPLELSANGILRAPGGEVALRAAGDLQLGSVDTRSNGVLAGAVSLVSRTGVITDAAADAAVNVFTQSLRLDGRGPLLAPGQTTMAGAIDVDANSIRIDTTPGTVARDTGTDGRTRFNLTQGTSTWQLLVAEGGAGRSFGSSAAPGAAAALSVEGLPAEPGRPDPGASLSALTLAAGSIDHGLIDAGPVDAGRLDRAWLLGATPGQPWAAGVERSRPLFEYWSDTLSL